MIKFNLHRIVYLTIAFFSMAMMSCEKFLAEKPDLELAVPSSLEDLQMLLDNYSSMNQQLPSEPILLSDNIYLTTESWESSPDLYRSLYIWEKDDNTLNTWYAPYNAISIANTVLDGLKAVPRTDKNLNLWNDIKGRALFFRARYFMALAELFAPAYHPGTIELQLGIPLRLNSDFNEKSLRSTVGETYEQIIRDFTLSARLLPVNSFVRSRPDRAAAYGALARTYLLMHDYSLAGAYADSSLALHNGLLDYNTLDSTAGAPFERFNTEVIFQIMSRSSSTLSPSRLRVDSSLFQKYEPDDLRRVVFFHENDDGTHSFKGDYDGIGNQGFVFGGITTDELYLIRAECAARTGSVSEAMQILNTLLEKRWKSGAFIPFTAADQHEALKIILMERRKELIFRGVRWSDIRRLADDPDFSITIERSLNGEQYMLLPQIPGYLVQIPEKVLRYSDLKQNP